jgi:hypothetical protein
MIDAGKKLVTADGDEGGEGGGDNKQAVIDGLQTKIEVMQKNFDIELRHAKEFAAQQAQALLDKKLMEARYTYNEELEVLAGQFEDMQAEVGTLKEDKLDLKRQIAYLEGIIGQQQGMIETTGYIVGRRDERVDPTPDMEKSIESFEEAVRERAVPDKATEIFTGALGVLEQPFSFYSFGVRLNAEQCREV